MRLPRSIIAFPVVAALALAGCEPIDEQQENGRAGTQQNGALDRLIEELDGTIDQAHDVSREHANRFIEEAELSLRRMRESIADARKRDDLTDEARGRIHAAAEQLEHDISRMDEELRRLRAEGATAWDRIGPRMQNAKTDLMASYERFKQTLLREHQAAPADRDPGRDSSAQPAQEDQRP